ncbi:ribosome hibernation-promoting factor, HPF/YfiA family [Sciscionella marina]|uniref:ribosome hibernation-promoting factor, HPF/YfiA family n=1 Tax=Sciscionella marina TaxID=508770 RepID=UPI00037A8147|nr:ribosome-associated translation inhibitor RaiA [Sciscionella marina]
MDIIVKGRNVEVPEHYRVHVAEKLDRLERYDKKFIRCDVELIHEPNRRQAKNCQRVQITARGKGPIVRAEACAGDFYAALDASVAKLESRLRKAHDRRKVHHGRRTPASVAAATNGEMPRMVPDVAKFDGRAGALATAVLEAPAREQEVNGEIPQQRLEAGDEENLPGRIVREKQHSAEPMTVDQALYEMELVGHDFYLFSDVTSGRPSVVYRRRGFDYGVIRLS